MIELIVVFIVLSLVVGVWFALCYESSKTLKATLQMFIGVPALIILMLSVLGFVIHSFIVVLS